MKPGGFDHQTVGWLVVLAIVLIWVHLPHDDRSMLHDLLKLATETRCQFQ